MYYCSFLWGGSSSLCSQQYFPSASMVGHSKQRFMSRSYLQYSNEKTQTQNAAIWMIEINMTLTTKLWHTLTNSLCVGRVQKPDSLGKLYEMDESHERRIWLDKLLQFMEERGTPISACPTISKNPLDLFRLYIYVKERGGFMEVCKVQCLVPW